MTDKERLDALTMNLELAARDIVELQQATVGLQQTTAALQEATAEFRRETAERFAQWEIEAKLVRQRMSHLDENVSSLANSTLMLLTVSQAHQTRIEPLELKSA